jgi:hypothetical protein
MAEGAEEDGVNARACRHQLGRPPDLVTGTDGISYLPFECALCGCEISLRLDSEVKIYGEFVVPPERKRA